jgi:itaconate CoA-transferase
MRLASQVLLDPELAAAARFASNPDRIAHVAELEEIIAATLATVPADEARSRLAAARIATARVNDLPQVWQHEQLRSRGRFVTTQTPTGPVQVLATPFDISGWSPPSGSVPGLDEHEQEVVDRIRARGEDGD